MNKSKHPIERWLVNNGYTKTWFCRALDINSGQLSKYCMGKQMPRDERLQKIKVITGGDITPNDMYSYLQKIRV